MRIIMYVLIVVAFIGIIGVPCEYLLEHLRIVKQYKAIRQDIDYKIRVWDSIAKSYDSVREAYEKGYAIARLVIYHHELEMLEEAYENGLCPVDWTERNVNNNENDERGLSKILRRENQREHPAGDSSARSICFDGLLQSGTGVRAGDSTEREELPRVS